MILGIDLNDCLMLNMEYIIYCSYGRLTPADFQVWDSPLGKKFGGITNKQFLDWAYKTPRTQLSARPAPGAREALGALKASGFEVQIVTASCMTTVQIQWWLNQYDIPFDGIVKQADKTDWPHRLIDDNEQTLWDRASLGLPSLCRRRPWNEGFSGAGFAHWDEVGTIITSLA